MQFCNVSHVFHLREPVHGNCHGKLFYLTRPHRPYAISFCCQWKSPDPIEQTPQLFLHPFTSLCCHCLDNRF